MQDEFLKNFEQKYFIRKNILFANKIFLKTKPTSWISKSKYLLKKSKILVEILIKEDEVFDDDNDKQKYKYLNHRYGFDPLLNLPLTFDSTKH